MVSAISCAGLEYEAMKGYLLERTYLCLQHGGVPYYRVLQVLFDPDDDDDSMSVHYTPMNV